MMMANVKLAVLRLLLKALSPCFVLALSLHRPSVSRSASSDLLDISE